MSVSLFNFQVYRRDSQEEVYAGSHQYPGQVNYLSKMHLSAKTKKVYFLLQKKNGSFVSGCLSAEVR